jgi:3-hydroxyacyl-[acyl-carrier-protein] dehydratase
MPPPLIHDPSSLDLGRVIVDAEAIRKVNPQRFEMEQLDAIVLIDRVQHLIAGYKDVRSDEFWVHGHMPGYPLLPGVLICEAAAQLSAYYIATAGLLDGQFLGFGGLEHVRFRGTVKPGDRLVLIGKGMRMNRRSPVVSVQGFVGNTMVFHGDIIGVPMQREGSGSEDARPGREV